MPFTISVCALALPTSAAARITPKNIFIRSFSFFRACCSHVDTLGAEKKSGVPYILTSARRHRQTPLPKHDEKTRHVDCPRSATFVSRFGFTLAKFSSKRQYAVAYVPPSRFRATEDLPESFRDSPAPRSAVHCRHGFPRFWPPLWRTRRSASLPLLRPGILLRHLCSYGGQYQRSTVLLPKNSAIIPKRPCQWQGRIFNKKSEPLLIYGEQGT